VSSLNTGRPSLSRATISQLQLRDNERWSILMMGLSDRATYRLSVSTSSYPRRFHIGGPNNENATSGHDEHDILVSLYENVCTGQDSALGFSGCNTLYQATMNHTDASSDICFQAPNRCNSEGHLTALYLSGGFSSIISDLPSSMGHFRHLVSLDISHNLIISDLSSIGRVLMPLSPTLRTLFLGANLIEGSFDCSIWAAFTNIEVLWVQYNYLVDSIPPCILQLPKLKELVISSNNLVGSLPSFLPSTIEVLDFSYNGGTAGVGLSGSLFPSFFASTPLLTFIDVSVNSLTGSLPPPPMHIQQYIVGSNNLSGSLDALTSSSTLVSFWGGRNYFSGTLPSLASYSSLQHFEAPNSKISGPLVFPPSPYLLSFDLLGNALTGSLPSSLGIATRIERLLLSNNRLQGNITPFLSSLLAYGSLIQLDLSSNLLTGSIPDLSLLGVFGPNTHTASLLDLSHNLLVGFFPAWAISSLLSSLPGPSRFDIGVLTCPTPPLPSLKINLDVLQGISSNYSLSCKSINGSLAISSLWAPFLLISNSQPQPKSIAPIVGAAVGGVVAILLLSVVLCLFIRGRRSDLSSRRETDDSIFRVPAPLAASQETGGPVDLEPRPQRQRSRMTGAAEIFITLDNPLAEQPESGIGQINHQTSRSIAPLPSHQPGLLQRVLGRKESTPIVGSLHTRFSNFNMVFDSDMDVQSRSS
jgi:hypothetical protein